MASGGDAAGRGISSSTRRMTVKILVTAKRVTDPDMKIKVKPDGTGIVTDSMNY